MSDARQSAILGLRLQELTSLVEELGQPSYRARQLFEAAYRHGVESLQEISTLPQQFRQGLADRGFVIGLPTVDGRFVSGDGTIRYLMGLADGQTVETVWMPEGDNGEAGDGSEAGADVELSP